MSVDIAPKRFHRVRKHGRLAAIIAAFLAGALAGDKLDVTTLLEVLLNAQ